MLYKGQHGNEYAMLGYILSALIFQWGWIRMWGIYDKESCTFLLLLGLITYGVMGKVPEPRMVINRLTHVSKTLFFLILQYFNMYKRYLYTKLCWNGIVVYVISNSVFIVG